MLRILSKPIIHNFYIRYNDIQKPIGMISKCEHAGVIYLLIATDISLKLNLLRS